MHKATLLGLLVFGSLVFAGFASAASNRPATAAQTGSDIVLNDDEAKLHEVGAADAGAERPFRAFRAQAALAVSTPALGTQKFWYSRNGNALVRDRLFTLTAVTAHSEVWVSTILNFKAGDCRNDGDRNVITTAQAEYLANQFETNIYPKESTEFS